VDNYELYSTGMKLKKT